MPHGCLLALLTWPPPMSRLLHSSLTPRLLPQVGKLVKPHGSLFWLFEGGTKGVIRATRAGGGGGDLEESLGDLLAGMVGDLMPRAYALYVTGRERREDSDEETELEDSGEDQGEVAVRSSNLHFSVLDNGTTCLPHTTARLIASDNARSLRAIHACQLISAGGEVHRQRLALRLAVRA